MRINAQMSAALATFACALSCVVDSAPALAGKVDPTTPKPLDGVMIEAVETYANPKNSALTLGVGIYPFNAYYTDLSLNLGYVYRIDQNWGWDIVGFSYFIPFQKNLTSQLADKYGVNPETIEKLQYMISSNIVFTHTYGKFLFLEDYIRYFRSSVFFGAGLINTTANSAAAGTLGARFEFFHGESFNWIFDVRDSITIYGDSYVTFTLGSGFNF